ncbi:MAG: ATP-binding cassette domain-containing protein, partial [Longimicrobiales bacterium]
MVNPERAAKISIENVSFRYEDGRESLQDITLKIYANEITALFGPAGAGKSTLLRVLNRLNDLAPKSHMSGRVFLDAEDIYAPSIDVT